MDIGHQMSEVSYRLHDMKRRHQIDSFGLTWSLEKGVVEMNVYILKATINEEIRLVFKPDKIRTISDCVLGRVTQVLLRGQ